MSSSYFSSTCAKPSSLPCRLADEGNARQKLSIEKQQLENKLKQLEETLATKDDSIGKIARDRAHLETRLKDTQSALEEEEDKGKALAKQRVKLESSIADLEEKLAKEEKVGWGNLISLTFVFCDLGKQFCQPPPSLYLQSVTLPSPYRPTPIS